MKNNFFVSHNRTAIIRLALKSDINLSHALTELTKRLACWSLIDGGDIYIETNQNEKYFNIFIPDFFPYPELIMQERNKYNLLAADIEFFLFQSGLHQTLKLDNLELAEGYQLPRTPAIQQYISHPIPLGSRLMTCLNLKENIDSIFPKTVAFILYLTRLPDAQCELSLLRTHAIHFLITYNSHFNFRNQINWPPAFFLGVVDQTINIFFTAELISDKDKFEGQLREFLKKYSIFFHYSVYSLMKAPLSYIYNPVITINQEVINKLMYKGPISPKYICQLSHMVMSQPVTLAQGQGHAERSELIKKASSNAMNPWTGQPFAPKDFEIDEELQGEINSFVREIPGAYEMKRLRFTFNKMMNSNPQTQIINNMLALQNPQVIPVHQQLKLSALSLGVGRAQKRRLLEISDTTQQFTVSMPTFWVEQLKTKGQELIKDLKQFHPEDIAEVCDISIGAPTC